MRRIAYSMYEDCTPLARRVRASVIFSGLAAAKRKQPPNTRGELAGRENYAFLPTT